MVSDFKTDDENVSVMTERSKSEVTSSISEDAANWLYTEAKPGEAKLFEKDNTFYVLQLTSINDNNYQTVNACSSTSRRMLPTRNTRTARRPPTSASPSLRLP